MTSPSCAPFEGRRPRRTGTAAGGIPAVALLIAMLFALGECRAMAVSPEPAPSLRRRLDGIRTAFLENDASAMVSHFSSTRPIYVVLPRYRAFRFLGPGPLRALLDRLARDTISQAFAFDLPDPPRPEPLVEIVHAKARWTYRDRHTGRVSTEDLYFRLHRDTGANWLVIELKATR